MLAVRACLPPRPPGGFVVSKEAAEGALVTLDAKSGEVRALVVPPEPPSAGWPDHFAHALLGVVSGQSAKWLAIVAHAAPQGMSIVKILGVELLLLGSGKNAISSEDAAFAQGVVATLSTGLFFYNTLDSGLDITKSTQHSGDDDFHFVFNRSFMRHLDNVPKSMLRPIIQGSISSFTVHNDVGVVLVTRRSAHNCGARYWCRGLNELGFAANTCETEIVMVHHGLRQIWALVLLRGSIPLQWEQTPTLRYTPRVVHGEDAESSRRFVKHVNRLRARYGPDVVALNLVNSGKGDQALLGSKYQRLCAEHRVPFVWFDFHRECRTLPYDDALNGLARRIAKEHDVGYYLRREDGVVVNRQNGVVRVNCMDNLDRTSVVQCGISLEPVKAQLDRWGVQVDAAMLKRQWLRAWERAADHVSHAYTGVPHALKKDFYAGTGQMSSRGALRDLLTSLTRYAQNTFFDGERSDLLVALAKGVVPARQTSKRAWLLLLVALGAILVFGPRESFLAASGVAVIAMRQGSSILSNWLIQRPSLRDS